MDELKYRYILYKVYVRFNSSQIDVDLLMTYVLSKPLNWIFRERTLVFHVSGQHVMMRHQVSKPTEEKHYKTVLTILPLTLLQNLHRDPESYDEAIRLLDISCDILTFFDYLYSIKRNAVLERNSPFTDLFKKYDTFTELYRAYTQEISYDFY